MRLKFISLLLIVLSMTLLHCSKESPSSSQGTATSSSLSSQTLGSVNYFKSPPPTSLAGEDGYTFLMKEYFGPQCSACHDGTVVFPSFADKRNSHESYLAAKYYFQNEDMVMRVTDNPYCRPHCTLNPQGEVYKAIRFWLDHRN
jgi:hypothetical protein